MDSSNIREDQAADLSRSIAPGLRYLARLHGRMERTGFPPDDPLFRLVAKAYHAVQHRAVHVHCLSCGAGVGTRQTCPAPRTTRGACREQARSVFVSSGLREGSAVVFLLPFRRRIKHEQQRLWGRAARNLSSRRGPCLARTWFLPS